MEVHQPGQGRGWLPGPGRVQGATQAGQKGRAPEEVRAHVRPYLRP